MSGLPYAPPDGYIAVTPADTGGADPGCAGSECGTFVGLLVGGTAGSVKAVDSKGNTVNLTGNVPIGTYIPGRFVRVFATGTTATGIYGALA